MKIGKIVRTLIFATFVVFLWSLICMLINFYVRMFGAVFIISAILLICLGFAGSLYDRYVFKCKEGEE